MIAGSGGEGRLCGHLQGTSGSALLREAGCPVVFVPTGAEDAAAAARS